MKFINLIAVALVAFLLAPDALAGGDQDATKLGVYLGRIDKTYASMSSSQELFEIPEFIKLYEHSADYVKTGLDLIKNDKMPRREREVYIYAMQKLTLPQYVSFSQAAIELWHKGFLDKEEIYLVVFPAYDWSTRFPEHYQNPDVIALLNSLRKDPQAKDKWDYIDQILSGQAMKEVLDLRSAEQIK